LAQARTFLITSYRSREASSLVGTADVATLNRSLNLIVSRKVWHACMQVKTFKCNEIYWETTTKYAMIVLAFWHIWRT